MNDAEKLHKEIGGTFITPAANIQDKLKNIRAIIFDWDGVFNNGEKAANGSSNFSEVDSMGTNMLRYSHFLVHDKLPLTAVISGEKNETAFYFCKRECFHYSFFKVANKIHALNFICEKENITPSQVAYFFDDVLDLSMAEVCGIRIQINQQANPLFVNYCVKHQLVDYITANRGGSFAVREATELLMGLNGNFDEAITNRKNVAPSYQTYIENRRKTQPEFFTLAENKIIKADLT